ncbi:unnamed protein product [Closterium sp. NIES-53]
MSGGSVGSQALRRIGSGTSFPSHGVASGASSTAVAASSSAISGFPSAPSLTPPSISSRSAVYFPPHRTQLPPRYAYASSASSASGRPRKARAILCFILLATTFVLLFSSALYAPFALSLSSSPSSSSALSVSSGRALGTISRSYSIIIDAGSTGSRVHVYSYTRLADPSALPLVDPHAPTLKIRPGLSSFAADPAAAGGSLVGLMDFAKTKVPRALWSATPVRLMATAGLRRLPASGARRILQSCAEVLGASGFAFDPEDGATVIAGVWEGVYAWVAANYAKGTLGGDARDSVGVVEMGGASAQVTFVPDEPPPDEYRHDISLAGVDYVLYSHSFLHYGQEAAEEAAETLVALVSAQWQQAEHGKQRQQQQQQQQQHANTSLPTELVVKGHGQVQGNNTGAGGESRGDKAGVGVVGGREEQGNAADGKAVVVSEPGGSAVTAAATGSGGAGAAAAGAAAEAVRRLGLEKQLWHGNPCRHQMLPSLLTEPPTSTPSSKPSSVAPAVGTGATAAEAAAADAAAAAGAAGKELALSSPRLPLQQQQQLQQLGHHRSANFSLCRHLATRLFTHGRPDSQHNPPAPCPYTHCPFAGGVFVPELRGQFFATENFFYTSEFLKLPATATLAEFAAAGTRHCAHGLPPPPSPARAKHLLKTQGESRGTALGDGQRGDGAGAGSGGAAVGAVVAAAVKLSRKEGLGMRGGAGRKREGKPGEGKGGEGAGVGEEGGGVVVSEGERGSMVVVSEEEVKEHGKYCFSASYIVAFLHDALGVSLHDTKVRFTNRVGPHDIDWALGAMLMDVITHRPIPSKTANQGEARVKASDSLRADESIGTIMVLLLVTALFLVVITLFVISTYFRPIPIPTTIFDLEKGRYFTASSFGQAGMGPVGGMVSPTEVDYNGGGSFPLIVSHSRILVPPQARRCHTVSQVRRSAATVLDITACGGPAFASLRKSAARCVARFGGISHSCLGSAPVLVGKSVREGGGCALRRAQLAAAAAATGLTPSSANASAAALLVAQQSMSNLAMTAAMTPTQQQWEQQQRQMLLLLLQQQRQQNAQLYMHRMALLSSASNHCRMQLLHQDQQNQQQQQQQQQINSIASMISSLKTSVDNEASHSDSPVSSPTASHGSISMPAPDLNLSSMNLAPVSSVYEDSSDSGASPTWTSPRAVHDFSASWGAEHDGYDCHADHEEGAGFDSAGLPSLLPLPSEEEFDSHLVAVQSAYVDQ